jgi:ABC-type multidrug transport system fused ATPase/permease subunit
MAAMLGQSFSGAHRAGDPLAGSEIDRFHKLNEAQAGTEERRRKRFHCSFPYRNRRRRRRHGDRHLRHIFWPPGLHAEQLPARVSVRPPACFPAQQLAGCTDTSPTCGGIHEVKAWLDTPHFPDRPFGTAGFTGLERALAFEHVSYKYPNGKLALDDIDFVVPVGQTIAIVGPSGAGKSTLANILLRLRAPSGGRVTIDGRDCWDFAPESWHRATALVEQDAFLFHGTLRENILYGCENLGEAALARALDAAQLTDVVSSLPDGLETLVGERGAMVSGGQRQRIAIARAVIRNPSILILDEATSHLDAVSERSSAGPPERRARPHHSHRPSSVDDP